MSMRKMLCSTTVIMLYSTVIIMIIYNNIVKACFSLQDVIIKIMSRQFVFSYCAGEISYSLGPPENT